MGLLSHRVERSEVKPGDHIYTWRAAFTYSHHGIYVGGSKVVHFTRKKEAGASGLDSAGGGWPRRSPCRASSRRGQQSARPSRTAASSCPTAASSSPASTASSATAPCTASSTASRRRCSSPSSAAGRAPSPPPTRRTPSSAAPCTCSRTASATTTCSRTTARTSRSTARRASPPPRRRAGDRPERPGVVGHRRAAGGPPLHPFQAARGRPARHGRCHRRDVLRRQVHHRHRGEEGRREGGGGEPVGASWLASRQSPRRRRIGHEKTAFPCQGQQEFASSQAKT
uniref:LRAT domain-containing protein n=1 Tax=Oryza brachyantha TaxID=4533 RepID=J3MV04_ORYBR